MDVEETFTVKEVVYKGRGDFEIRIHNTGNVMIPAKQLEIQPLYYVLNQPAIMGAVVSNRGSIPVGQIRRLYGYGRDGLYFNNMAECSAFKKMDFLIRNTRTGQSLTSYISIPHAEFKIKDVDMYDSNLIINVQNQTPYRASSNFRILWMIIYDARYPQKYGKERCTIKDAFHSKITLDAGATGTLSFSLLQTNSEIKKHFPNLKKGLYMAKLQAEVYSEKATEACNQKNVGIVYDQITVLGFNHPTENISYSP